MITGNPDIDDEAVAMITCAFYNAGNAVDKTLIGDLCGEWNTQVSTLNAWTAPTLKMSALGAYVLNSTSW